MQTTPLTTDSRPGVDPSKAPPIWWQHRDDPPSRPIAYAVVSINGRRVGRIDKPEVMEVETDDLLERFPALYGAGEHEIKLDFRAERGRGALGHVTLTIGEPSVHQQPGPSTPEGAMVEWASKLMAQNERLQKLLMESVQTHAHDSMTSHERLMSMMAASMERDRNRQADWLDRQERLTTAQHDRAATGSTGAAEQQARMIELFLPLLMSQQGPQDGMAQIQDAITNKLLGSVMEKIDTFDPARTGADDPMSAMVQSFAPLLAAKLAPQPPQEMAPQEGQQP